MDPPVLKLYLQSHEALLESTLYRSQSSQEVQKLFQSHVDRILELSKRFSGCSSPTVGQGSAAVSFEDSDSNINRDSETLAARSSPSQSSSDISVRQRSTSDFKPISRSSNAGSDEDLATSRNSDRGTKRQCTSVMLFNNEEEAEFINHLKSLSNAVPQNSTDEEVNARLPVKEPDTGTEGQQRLLKRRMVSDTEVTELTSADWDHNINENRNERDNDDMSSTSRESSADSFQALSLNSSQFGPQDIPRISPSPQEITTLKERSLSEQEEEDMLEFVRFHREELKKEGESDIFDPMQTYRSIQQRVDVSYYLPLKTAADVTKLVWSFGSSKCIAALRDVLEQQRSPWGTGIFYQRCPVTLPELANALDWGCLQKTWPSRLFRRRYDAVRFYKLFVIKQDSLLRDGECSTPKSATLEACARILEEARPGKRYCKTASTKTPRVETKDFKRRLSDILEAVELGRRWGPLQQRFGVGILALLNGTNLRDNPLHDIWHQEKDVFQLFLNHITEDRNVYNQWLWRISSLIGSHLTQDHANTLKLSKLKLEIVPVEEIMACQERSVELAGMCMPVASKAEG
jgi:hypothetical protein